MFSGSSPSSVYRLPDTPFEAPGMGPAGVAPLNADTVVLSSRRVCLLLSWCCDRAAHLLCLCWQLGWCDLVHLIYV